jgi:hypothetical protein
MNVLGYSIDRLQSKSIECRLGRAALTSSSTAVKIVRVLLCGAFINAHLSRLCPPTQIANASLSAEKSWLFES